jgi:hypothetical protein
LLVIFIIIGCFSERAAFPPEPMGTPPPDSDDAHEEYIEEEVEMEQSELEESLEHSPSEESASDTEETEDTESDSGETASSGKIQKKFFKFYPI